MLKILLKVRFQAWLAYLTGKGQNSALKNKGGKGKAVLFGVLYLYLIAVFLFMFFAMFSALAPTFGNMGLGWFYFSYFATIAFVFMFVFSVFTAKAQLFEAKDNELLLSMPIPPSAVLGSRMLSLLLTNFAFELLVALPAAVAWCMSCPVSVMGAVAFVLICLALPFFSLSISALFGWVLALITARVRRKSLVSTVFSLCFLAAYFYIYSHINTILSTLITNASAIADSLSAAAPLYWLGLAVAEGDALSLVLSLACLIIPFVIVYFVLAKTFIRTATTRRGAAKLRYVKREARVASAFTALLRRETARLLSSSTYIMNSAMGAIMSVVLAVVLVVKGADIVAALAALGDMSALVEPVLVLALCALASMTTISACAVSLEGKNLWIVRSMPVNSASVLRAKLALHILVSAPGMLLAQIACAVVFKPTGLMLLWTLILPQLFNLLLALVGLWANLNHPKLEWQNETQAVKQGIAVVIAIFGGWGLLVLPLVAGVLLSSLPHGMDIVAAGYFLIVTVLAVLLYKWCMKRGAEIFEKL